MAKQNKATLKDLFDFSLTGTILAITGALGAFASLMLSIEEFIHLKNPNQSLNCDLNPLVGCGSILDTWQGHVFLGVPNQFWGLAAFSVLAMIGVLLIAKVQLPRWIWQGLQIGMLGGVLFVLWFIYQSMFVLNHLCPYCMLTWTVTLIAAWYTTIHNVKNANFKIPARLQKIASFSVRHHFDIIITIFLVIIMSILTRFWDFWISML